MAFDYKKEYKEFYLPKHTPQTVEVPAMNFIAVDGRGDPNEPDGEYKTAVGLLYTVAFTIKMSRRTQHQIDGFFDYVVPPLEGFWEMDGINGIDYSHKEKFCWTLVIRLPDFVGESDFLWAVRSAQEKKDMDFSSVKFLTLAEGLCVQALHIGSYDDEPATIDMLHGYAAAEGLEVDITHKRRHHEIYLSDARRCAPEKLRTVIRLPVKKGGAEK